MKKYFRFEDIVSVNFVHTFLIRKYSYVEGFVFGGFHVSSEEISGVFFRVD